ncbi:hypothetical protein [Flavobacterium commune]|nr:hypothetical protein [Flavobacterium commune]
MITSDTLSQIESLFRTLQMLSCPSVQIYDERQEYRCYCLWAKGWNWKRESSSVHINFPKEKVNAWLLKNWEKRKTKIPHESFMIEFPNEEIVRFGFKV